MDCTELRSRERFVVIVAVLIVGKCHSRKSRKDKSADKEQYQADSFHGNPAEKRV